MAILVASNAAKGKESKLIFRFDHNSHSKWYHVDIDLFVAYQVHFEKIVRFGLPKLSLVDVIQFLQKDEFQLLNSLVNFVDVSELIICFFSFFKRL